MAFFQYMTGGTLMQPLNLTNLVLQNSYIVVMALGMLLVIVAGHIDLSVGSVCGFVGALAAVLMVEYEWHFVPTFLACLVAGAAVGSQVGREGGYYDRDVQRCTNVSNNAQPDYYDVTYNFRGIEHHVQLSTPPGPTIGVNADGEPRG
jgi:hypothetical protein